MDDLERKHTAQSIATHLWDVSGFYVPSNVVFDAASRIEETLKGWEIEGSLPLENPIVLGENAAVVSFGPARVAASIVEAFQDAFYSDRDGTFPPDVFEKLQNIVYPLLPANDKENRS